jgi:hypothetical protein
MKKLIQPAALVLMVAAGLTACKKENIQVNEPATPEVHALNLNLPAARLLVKKGTDSILYSAGGTVTKVIYSPTKFVSYLKSGNILTASTFESNVLKSKIEYTITNGRTTQSKHTSYESNVAVSKTWLYDYNNDGRLVEKYNKDNHNERIKFVWVGLENFAQVKWYSAANQLIAILQFTRNTQVDKIKINSPRSSLDPYLKIFGVQSSIMSTGEDMTYTLSPGSNFKESFTFTYDRDGYPVKVNVYDPTDWSFKYSHTFSYNN